MYSRERRGTGRAVVCWNSGFEWYRQVRIPADEPPPPPVAPQPAEDDLDLDREIEYAFDTDEPMLGPVRL